jgi:hypothetical protein
VAGAANRLTAVSQLEQQAGQSLRQPLVGHFFHAILDLGEALADGLQQPPTKDGIAQRQRLRLGLGHSPEDAIGERNSADARVYCAEQRALSEHGAGTEGRDRQAAAVRPFADQLHPALHQRVKVLAQLLRICDVLPCSIRLCIDRLFEFRVVLTKLNQNLR